MWSDIYWVFWREIKKFIQNKARITMAIIQPLVWLVLMGNAMSGLTNNPMAIRMLGTTKYLDFMTPGIMIMTSLFGGVSGGSSVLWDRRLGFLNKMFTSPIYQSCYTCWKAISNRGAGYAAGFIYCYYCCLYGCSLCNRHSRCCLSSPYLLSFRNDNGRHIPVSCICYHFNGNFICNYKFPYHAPDIYQQRYISY